MQQGPGGVRGEEEGGGANEKDGLDFGKSRRGKEEEFVWRSAWGNCARRSTMELCAWALEFLVILVINN